MESRQKARNFAAGVAVFKDSVRTHLLFQILFPSDLDGSLKAIFKVLEEYDSDSPQCKMQLVDFCVGPPNDTDIELAGESNAIVYCFNTKMSPLVSHLVS
uniref:IF-2 domain-containing protein n=1 Tax=Steinernema glaseri TaxID=37863 RepID=A0A1I7ZJR5_9BILA